MLVFDTKTPRTFRVEPTPDTDALLGILQDRVGGNIEFIPHKEGEDAPFVAYANEEGMISNLPVNFLSGGVLRQLGFLGYNFHHGNVVLLGKDEAPLSDADVENVRAAHRRYLAREKRKPVADNELETARKTKRPRKE